MNQTSPSDQPEVLTSYQDQAHTDAANNMTETFIKHYESALELHGEFYLKERIDFDNISFLIKWNMKDNDINEFKSALQMMGGAVQSVKDEEHAKTTVRNIAAAAVMMTMERIEDEAKPEEEKELPVKQMHHFANTILSVKEAQKGWPNIKICTKCKVQKITDRSTFKVYYQKVVGGIAYQSPNMPECSARQL